MTPKRLSPERGSTPSFVKPFLHALDRMQERESIRPDQYIGRAILLLIDRFGSSDGSIEAAFAHGCLGLQADHTHYFNGFALVMTMRNGMAVAVRESQDEISRIVVEGSSEVLEFDLKSEPPENEDDLVGLVRCVLLAVTEEPAYGFEVAILGSVPVGLEPVFIASTATALSRAIEAHEALSYDSTKRLRVLSPAISHFLGHLFSPAYLIGSSVTSPEVFLLVDTENGEHLPLPVPEQERPGLVLIDVGGEKRGVGPAVRLHRADEALERLRQKAFPDLASFRDLEHRDLEAALGAVPRRLKPIVRYLVTENRRVQKLVAAIQRRDWQLFGALLIMSHSGRKGDWEITSDAIDRVIDEAERFSLEGVYGATQTGEGSFAVVVGQPFSLPAFLDHLRSTWPEHTTRGPDTFIL